VARRSKEYPHTFRYCPGPFRLYMHMERQRVEAVLECPNYVWARLGACKEPSEKMGSISPWVLVVFSLAIDLGGTPSIGTVSIGSMQENLDAPLIGRWMKRQKVALLAVAVESCKNLLQCILLE
jgi:hypothetical protein